MWSPYWGKVEVIVLLFFGLWTVCCQSWFACTSLGVIGRQWSVIVSIPIDIIYTIFHSGK